MTTTDPLDYLQGMIAAGVPPLARYAQPGTVASLPEAPVHDDLPVVAEPGRWTTYVWVQRNGLYRLTAKCGSMVQAIPNLTFTDVETFDGDERWGRPAPRLERLLAR